MQPIDFFATLSAADKSAFFGAGPIQPWIVSVYQAGPNSAADEVIQWAFRNGRSDGTVAEVAYEILCTLDSALISNLITMLSEAQVITTGTTDALRSVLSQ